MKKRIKKVFSMVGIIMLLVVLFFVANTFSKYIAQVNGVGNAGIAKWKFKVNGQEDNLGTIKLSDNVNPASLVQGKIAPGTSGNFDLVLDATGSEVAVDYKVDFSNETNKPTHLTFTYQGNNYNSLEALEKAISGTINANDETKVRTLNITWQWPLEGQGANYDLIDTTEAKTIDNYSFDVAVSGIQSMK